MSIASIRRDAVALATLLRHRVQGFNDNLLFSNSGESAVTLSGDPGAAQQHSRGSALDLDADLDESEFVIAKQTNFPPTGGIREGAQIWFPATVTDYYYEVQSWRGDGQADDGICATYTLRARRTQVRRIR